MFCEHKKLAEGEKMTYAVYNHAHTPARMHTHLETEGQVHESFL